MAAAQHVIGFAFTDEIQLSYDGAPEAYGVLQPLNISVRVSRHQHV